jgi:hypothetical protein
MTGALSSEDYMRANPNILSGIGLKVMERTDGVAQVIRIPA